MAEKPVTEFGKRRPVVVQPPAAPVKRSRHVALLLAGTVAVGGGAYALMPGGVDRRRARAFSAAIPQQAVQAPRRRKPAA
jgi:hypothetical protein